ncbi:gamma-glutamylputrescine oxidase [Hydromonas duriensis]|uniref:Gamma-glutamylputrescine oxidase n=2 Tax=Hydromonas duriensis TaxID=1527608 RepID=A0A4R6Y3E9_9BURK|nr:gamma-glutamylputrescine oxidase [Hydromonas duriensis]
MYAQDEKLTQNSYYAATSTPLPEQPRLQGAHSFDVCVVGAGLAGLSAALELAQAGYKVAILEGKRIAWGASGRNGGQAIAGYACDQEPFEKQLGLDDAKKAFNITLEGLDLMRERIVEHNIQCDWIDGYMTASVKPKTTPDLYAWADRLADVYSYPYLEKISPEDMPQWVASKRYHGGVLDKNSAHLHPLKYALGLARAAMSAGVKIFENSLVTQLIQGDPAIVKTAEGQITAAFVVLAGNVYLDQVAPKISGRIMPVGTYIVTTEQLDPQLAGSLIRNRIAVCDNNFVLDYFRVTNDSRMLFGGRVSYSGMTPHNLSNAMRHTMLRAFPQLENAKIEYCWGGFVDITTNRAPDFGRLSSNVYYLQGFSGHGLILTGIAGKMAAQAIQGQAERFDMFSKLKHLPFPGGRALRTPALVLAMAYYRLRDYL